MGCRLCARQAGWWGSSRGDHPVHIAVMLVQQPCVLGRGFAAVVVKSSVGCTGFQSCLQHVGRELTAFFAEWSHIMSGLGCLVTVALHALL